MEKIQYGEVDEKKTKSVNLKRFRSDNLKLLFWW